MRSITEKQKQAIQKLAQVTKTTVHNVEQMSSADASAVITALIEKRNGQKSSENGADKNTRVESRDFKSDALAGLAVKILAQQFGVPKTLFDKEKFKENAVDLYKVFQSAREACLA